MPALDVTVNGSEVPMKQGGKIGSDGCGAESMKEVCASSGKAEENFG